MICVSLFPFVSTRAIVHSLVAHINLWGSRADNCASIAIWILPSVPFLKPIGQESPDASSLCICDSVVRAPIAHQLMKSARYCGLIGSRNSVAVGTHRVLISQSNLLAVLRPCSM